MPAVWTVGTVWLAGKSLPRGGISSTGPVWTGLLTWMGWSVPGASQSCE